MPTKEKVLAMLAQITEVSQVKQDLDLQLYETGILDSLKTVELIVAFSEQLGIDISPAEFEREEWATPRAIVAALQRKVS
ncbi:MAG: D-alanine--poly(phosphoribitol) ligase subunit DltC [Chloroflexi bacterium]|nr:D-alanine--poly(phosphoribitol) ligase subunit DltC [Chloroflexota bacterium]